MGVVVLLLTNTLSWDEMLQNADAWDIMIWLGGLVVMAGTPLLLPTRAFLIFAFVGQTN